MNSELPKTKIDERTEIEYHLEGDYYIPNLVLSHAGGFPVVPSLYK